jgi:hypothetical protein
MTPTVKADPADLIALAWYQLGYRPADSLVMIGLHGPRQQAGVVARGDLPPRGQERAAVLALAGPLLESGAEGAVLLICTADACRAEPPRVLRAALRLLPELVLDVVDVWAVGATGYRSYRCTDPGCCPRDGRPLDDVLRSRVAAELVLQGCTLVEDEADLVADVLPDPVVDGPAAADDGAAGGAVGATGGADGGEDGGEPDPAELLARWRAALAEAAEPGRPGDGGPAAPALVPQLGRALADRRLRDAVMVTLVPGGDRVAEALLHGDGGDALDACLRACPDHELLDRGVRLLAAAARAAGPGFRAGPLGALAWLAWWNGQGARARLLVERALADRPDHRLALLVDGLLELAVPPPWVARAEAS